MVSVRKRYEINPGAWFSCENGMNKFLEWFSGEKK
jgi:hypothetical protein